VVYTEIIAAWALIVSQVYGTQHVMARTLANISVACRLMQHPRLLLTSKDPTYTEQLDNPVQSPESGLRVSSTHKTNISSQASLDVSA
jgi:hypothetical protein